jgi:branched-chain amino acid transport system substrate-binding protein
MMRRMLAGCTVAAALFASGTAFAADAPLLKIGVVYSYTGTSPDNGIVLDAALNAYLLQHKGMIAGRKVQLIHRDDTGVAPDVAKRLSQELIVQDNVDFLIGSAFTPNGVAMEGVSTQAKKPFCIVNAAGTNILLKAPYTIRLGVTMPQIAVPLAQWAAKNGVKTVYTVVADYAPGIDGANSFAQAFTANGGKMLGEVRVPVNNTEFSAYIQRVKDAKPDAVFVFVGAGPSPVAFFKTFRDAGLERMGIRVIASGDALQEDALPAMGDEPNGVISSLNYSAVHDSKLNRAFVSAFHASDKDAAHLPNFTAVAGYDCLAAIDRAIAKANGSTDPDKIMDAWKGMKFESPRGPIEIDAQTRDIIQNMYMRRTEKRGPIYVDSEFATIPAVKFDAAGL